MPGVNQAYFQFSRFHIKSRILEVKIIDHLAQFSDLDTVHVLGAKAKFFIVIQRHEDLHSACDIDLLTLYERPSALHYSIRTTSLASVDGRASISCMDGLVGRLTITRKVGEAQSPLLQLIRATETAATMLLCIISYNILKQRKSQQSNTFFKD